MRDLTPKESAALQRLYRTVGIRATDGFDPFTRAEDERRLVLASRNSLPDHELAAASRQLGAIWKTRHAAAMGAPEFGVEPGDYAEALLHMAVHA